MNRQNSRYVQLNASKYKYKKIVVSEDGKKVLDISETFDKAKKIVLLR